MRPLREAQRDVLAAIEPLPEAEVPLREVRGLVLTRSVVAAEDVPPFPNSALDGYAVRNEDLAEVPIELPVLEDVPAGSVAARPLEPGGAIKIMTGAPMPTGADTIVAVEDTEPGSGFVRILVRPPAGNAVRPAGGDVPSGATVLRPGEELTAAHLGVLAALGVARPPVRRRPLVGILSTGDEVVPPETATLGPGQIRDTNRILLRALVEEAGGVVIDFGIVPDDAIGLRRVLGHAAAETDLVVTSGGVSMGEYDLVKQVLARIGDVSFWKVAMKPGKPFAFGRLGDTPLFGLPGNPVSVMVSFEQFVRPALLQMKGAAALFRPRVPGVLRDGVSTDPAKTVFLRVAVTESAGRWDARLSGGQESNVLSAAAAANALAVVPQGVGDLEPNSAVALEMLRWPASRTAEEVFGE